MVDAHPRYSAATRTGSLCGLADILVDAPLDLGAEMGDEALDRPGRRVAEARRSYGPRPAWSRRAACRSRASAPCPPPCASSPATSSPCLRGRACIGRSSHACRNSDSRAIARTMSVDLSITITAAVPRPDLQLARASRNPSAQSMIWAAGTQAHRRAAGNDGEQIVPAAANAAAMPVDQFAERDRHRLFDVAGPVDVAGDAEELGAGIVRRAEAREPRRAAAQDRPARPRSIRHC